MTSIRKEECDFVGLNIKLNYRNSNVTKKKHIRKAIDTL